MNPGIIATCAALLLFSAPAFSQILGTASQFAVLGATPSVTNTGPTLVFGSVGIFPAASITGFPPGQIVPGTGTFHAANAVAQQAQLDNTAAYTTLAGLPSVAIPAGLGGQVLGPNVYSPIAGNFDLTGILTLNGPGLYVFQTAALTTASGPGAAVVNLIGATPCDVWWQVGSSAAIGTFTQMQGNILALTSITIATSARVEGRALAQTGTVTLQTNNVNACFGGSTPGFNVPGAFVVYPGQAETPTLSEWAMILLAGLLAIAGFAALRRKAT